MEYDLSSANQTISPSGLKTLNFWQMEEEQRSDKKNRGRQKGTRDRTGGMGSDGRECGSRTESDGGNAGREHGQTRGIEVRWGGMGLDGARNGVGQGGTRSNRAGNEVGQGGMGSDEGEWDRTRENGIGRGRMGSNKGVIYDHVKKSNWLII